MAKAERPTASMPLDIQAQLAAEAALIHKRIAAPTGDRIRYKNSQALIAPDGSEGAEMEVVIIDFVSTNFYYDRPYDKDVVHPPACFAIGPEPSLLVPDATSPVRQADTCSGCPHNQFGSAINGKGKACKNGRLVAVTPADATEGDAPVWILSVPPASIKTFDAYVSNLAVRNKTIPLGVKTRVSMDTTQQYATPLFDLIAPLTAEELPLFMANRDEAKQRLTTPPDVSGYEPPKAARGVRR
jgi:hypothetical protein